MFVRLRSPELRDLISIKKQSEKAISNQFIRDARHATEAKAAV